MSYRKRVSLKDIAKKAGVSPALVSFVLNGKAEQYRVSKDTSEKIKRVAAEMQYKPNFAARSLRSGKTQTLGLVVSDISNPFFAHMARILEDAAAKLGYLIIIGSSEENAGKMERVVDNLIQKGVDGMIIVPCEGTSNYIKKLAEKKVPIVLFDRYFPELDVNYVALDNYQTSYNAMKHIIDLGYRTTGFVAYDVELIHMEERIRGYKQAMIDAGLEENIYVRRIKQNIKVFDSEQDLPLETENVDSFLFSTCMVALTCINNLRKKNKDFLEKVGLFTFDRNVVFDFIDRDIEYIIQPLEEMVETALHILVETIHDVNYKENILFSASLGKIIN